MTWKILDWREDAGKLASCIETAKLTKETQDALQVQYDAINARLARSKRVPAACIPPRLNAGEAGAEYAGSNGRGISSEWLLEYAATAERYRQERIALEKLLGN